MRDATLDFTRSAVVLGYSELNHHKVPSLHPETFAKFGRKQTQALLQVIVVLAHTCVLGGINIGSIKQCANLESSRFSFEIRFFFV